MKFDIKSILILVLLLTTLIFGYKWFFGSDSASAERIKQLEQEYKELEKKKKENEVQINALKASFDTLKLKDDSLKVELNRLEGETKHAEIVAAQSKNRLSKLQAELAETRHKIEEFKKSPPNREGDNLLQSLKNKTQ
jgi:peptidoglycan hydrolase CwlO-like protein